MAIILKQSTASQEVLLGPFLDDTDGKTAETGLTIANTDIKIWKAGGTTEASKNSGGATHIAAGRYYAVLDATDTDTLGPMEINVHVAGALPVRRECVVLTAAAYDLMVGTTVPLTATTIADGMLARDISAITESAMPKKGLYAAIAKLVNKNSSTAVVGQNLVYRSDGTTEHYRQALTTDAAAAPITVVGGAA
jgi:hypothetical protein